MTFSRVADETKQPIVLDKGCLGVSNDTPASTIPPTCHAIPARGRAEPGARVVDAPRAGGSGSGRESHAGRRCRQRSGVTGGAARAEPRAGQGPLSHSSRCGPCYGSAPASAAPLGRDERESEALEGRVPVVRWAVSLPVTVRRARAPVGERACVRACVRAGGRVFGWVGGRPGARVNLK